MAFSWSFPKMPFCPPPPPPPPPSFSSSSSFPRHDVFLSFRGEDIRTSFITHLDKQLCHSGISTFTDDKMERGQVISSELDTAIENSMYSIVVLSPNFASSRWCLEELVKILDCKREKGQKVFPVFYDIDPADVQNQTGKIGKDLTKLESKLKENMERVQIYRNALTEVGNLSGWDSRNKNDDVLIEEIVATILKSMYNDWRKLIDGGMGRMKPFVKTKRESVHGGMGPMIPFVEINRESVARIATNLVGAIMACIQLINGHDNLDFRTLKRKASSIRASIRSSSPNHTAIMNDLRDLADEMRDLIKFIGPVDDAAVRDLIQLTRELEALIGSLSPFDSGNW